MSDPTQHRMPPSLHRTDALRAALHRFCEAARQGYAAGAQTARDEALLRIPVASIDAAKAAILDYQLIYMEAVETQAATLRHPDHAAAMATVSGNLSQVVIRLARMEVEPK